MRRAMRCAMRCEQCIDNGVHSLYHCGCNDQYLHYGGGVVDVSVPREAQRARGGHGARRILCWRMSAVCVAAVRENRRQMAGIEHSSATLEWLGRDLATPCETYSPGGRCASRGARVHGHVVAVALTWSGCEEGVGAEQLHAVDGKSDGAALCCDEDAALRAFCD